MKLIADNLTFVIWVINNIKNKGNTAKGATGRYPNNIALPENNTQKNNTDETKEKRTINLLTRLRL